LDDTLVLFTTEFGRTPFTQSAADQVGKGATTISMASPSGSPAPAEARRRLRGDGRRRLEGCRKTASPGPTSTPPCCICLGIDHTRLTFYHNGIQRRLTNVHGEVVHGILA